MSTLPATITNLVSTLEAAQAATPQTGGDFAYLKMTKQGEWLYGGDETEVDAESFFVIDPNSYAQGYVAWYDGELINEVMTSAAQTPPTLADLPALPDKPKTIADPKGCVWASQVAFALKGVEGPEEGVQLLYKVSSKGGIGAIKDLLSTIINRGKSGKPDICPIVGLDNTSYKHKKYGKIFTPVLTVDEWVDLPVEGAVEPTPEPEPEPTPEPTPARKPRRSRAK